MSNVRVRVETPMLGYEWHQEVEVTKTEFITNAIEAGRLTVIDELHEEPVQDVSGPAVDVDLKGELLDKALEAAGLPKSGSAEAKRDRLAAHQAAEAQAASAEKASSTQTPAA